MDVTADELARVTRFLAKQAHTFAVQAGVGSMETVGGFVSFLAANPEKCEAWIKSPLDTLHSLGPDFWAHGCLSWHTAKGDRIYTPAEARRDAGIEQ